jgi:hypothetical protein
MRTDSEIKKDAEDELCWDPDIDATDVAVAVHNGVVTLRSFFFRIHDASEMWMRNKLMAIKAPLLKGVTIATVFAPTGGNERIHRFFETRGGNCREVQHNAIRVSEGRRLQRGARGA